MNASRAAVMVVGVNLIAVWVAAAAGGRAAQPQGQPDARGAQDRAVVQAQSALVEATDRLRRHIGPSLADAAVRRDPFTFAGARLPRPEPASAGPVTPELAPAPAPAPTAPEIVLQGMAESRDGESIVRTAILDVGGELVFATMGAIVGERFTVVAITADSVELEARLGGAADDPPAVGRRASAVSCGIIPAGCATRSRRVASGPSTR